MLKKFKDVSNVDVLIDFNNQVYRSHYATEKENLLNSDGINTGCIIGLCKVLRQAINEAKKICSLPRLIICKDQKPKRKRDLYAKYQEYLEKYNPDKDWDGKDHKLRIKYKGNRIRQDLDYNPIEICEQFIRCLPCSIVYSENEEADDVIASYIYSNQRNKMHVYSTDKDLWQLIDRFPNISIFLNGNDDESIKHPSKELMLKHFETTDYNKISLHKTIRGDSGDNVKSILRYPFKHTIEVYHECDGTIEDYLKKLIDKFGVDHKYVNHFMEYIYIVQLNWQVVKLKFDIKLNVENNVKPDSERWNKLCWQFETPSLLNSALLKIY